MQNGEPHPTEEDRHESGTDSRSESPATSTAPTSEFAQSEASIKKLPLSFVPTSFCTYEERNAIVLPDQPASFPPLPKELLSVPDSVDKADEGTPDGWLKRDGRLVRLTGKHPFS